MMTLRTAAVGSLAFALSACGGNVSLGGKSSQPGGAAGATDSADAASSSPGKRVLKRPGFTFGSLITAGDYLYFAGTGSTGSDGSYAQGIYRCRKADCEATFEQFVNGNITFLQAFDDRLGFTKWVDDSWGFSTVALSNGKDEQVAIQGLPSGSSVPSLFHDGSVFFSLAQDRGLYRCALPSCADNPTRIARTTGRTVVTPRAEGDILFWSEYSFIFRAARYGAEPAVAHLPDDALSEAPASTTDPEHLGGDQLESIDVGNGRLYANVGRSSSGLPCDSFCPHDLVSWPIAGGTAQHLFTSDGRLSEVQIFDGELVWLEPSKTSRSVDVATVSSCRIEACNETRRDLGEATFEHANVVADDQDVYWVEVEALPPPDNLPSGGFSTNQIRRAPRLPAP